MDSVWNGIQMTCSGLRILPEAVRLFAYSVDGAPGPDLVGCLFLCNFFQLVFCNWPECVLYLYILVFQSVRQVTHMRRNGHEETRIQRGDWLEFSVPRCHKKTFTANLTSRTLVSHRLQWMLTHEIVLTLLVPAITSTLD